MSFRKAAARRKKLAKLERTFAFKLRPQSAEHNGHWSENSWSDKKWRKLFDRIGNQS